MLREFVDLVSFVITEPIKIAVEIIDDLVGKVDSVIDNSPIANLTNIIEKTTLEPRFGSVIYCEILFGGADHSGIYVGNRQAVALNGNGEIVKVSIENFTNNLTSLNHNIYIPCCGVTKLPINFPGTGNRALSKIGKHRNYHILLDNCHQFVAGCLTDDFNNHCNFLWMLKDLVEKKHEENVTWLKWDWR